MRSRIARGFFLGLLVVAMTARGEDVDWTERIASADQCLEHVRQLAQQINVLAVSARQSNQVARARCLQSGGDRLNGLLEIIGDARERLTSYREQEDIELIEVELTNIAAACQRAEVVAVQAGDCRAASLAPPQPASRNARREEIQAQPRMIPAWFGKPPVVLRTKANCLSQGRGAWLLARAMGLVEELTTPEAAQQLLEQRQIGPSDGWQPEACLSLDTFARVVTQALRLKVRAPDGPAAYLGALREYGLPVDTLLPESNGSPGGPWLLEAEVIEFLSQGLAAPPPNAQSVMPF